MKFTRFFILCHKTLSLPSPTIFLLFVFNIDITISQPKIKNKNRKNANKMDHSHPSLSTLNVSAMAEIILKKPQKLSENCRNIVTLLPLEQQLTLFMCMWLSHVLGNHQKNRAVYSFTLYKLCLILNFLCSTAQKVTLRYLGTQQTGPVLDG